MKSVKGGESLLRTRRGFLKTGSLAAGAVALGGRGLLGQAGASTSANASVDARIEMLPSEPIGVIAPEIYSHFIEHLGGVIYDGVWVGEGSKIPNRNGIRSAFIETMKAVGAPVLRWPGGCFADSYDWRDGIGPRAKRPRRSAFWNQEDSNAFGTHEFMETCRAIGCKPYLAADVRSLPARDFYQWVEYCNAPAGSNTLGNLRAANGSSEPFNVQYWGVGNESWGCGSSQTAEEYAAEYRRYTAWVPKYGPETTPKMIACGPNGDDVRWTQGLMRSLGAGHLPFGLSTHYYTSGDAKKFARGDALAFDAPEYYDMLVRASHMEKIVTDHWQALSEVDREHRVKLVIDEWGAWYGKGTELGPQYNLSQQSTMRDALLSGITLDIFQNHADKVGMANVAQTINCLHSLMLAKEDKFTVTPTFHVFKMYMGHRGAQAIRTEFSAASIANPMAGHLSPVGGNSAVGSIVEDSRLAGLSGSASTVGHVLTLTVVNPHLDRALTTEISAGGASIQRAEGMVLVAPDIHAHNDFDHPDAVKAVAASVGTPSGGRLLHSFPAGSVTALTLRLG